MHYVLFDEDNSLPWVFHLFYKDSQFMINIRDDRFYVIGNTLKFDNFEEAKSAFIGELGHFIETNRFKRKIGKTPVYPSLLGQTY